MSTPDRVARGAARYGVPAVLLVFYLTALGFLGHTPESAVGGLMAAESYWDAPSGGPDNRPASPLWMLLLRLLQLPGLDPLLGARAMSLAFGSLSLLVQFLLVHEAARDRLAALSMTLAAGGLLWLAPSAADGTPVTLALLLVLTGLLLQLRNEYPLAALLFGMGGLLDSVLWAALPLLMADALVNSVDARRGRHVAAGVAVVWSAVVAPWLVFAAARGVSPLLRLPPWSPLPEPGAAVSVLALVLLVLIGAAGADLSRRPGAGRRAAGMLVPGFLLGIVLLGAGAAGWSTLLPGMCMLLAFAALAVRVLLERRGRSPLAPAAAALVAAVVLLIHQVEVHRHVLPAVRRSAQEAEDLAAIGGWLRAGGAAGRAVESVRPLYLQYRSGRPVAPPGGGGPEAVVVAEGGGDAGLLFRPPPAGDDAGGLRSSTLAVWERRAR